MLWTGVWRKQGEAFPKTNILLTVKHTGENIQLCVLNINMLDAYLSSQLYKQNCKEVTEEQNDDPINV